MRWIVLSVVLSVGLTVLVNLALRLFPGAARRLARRTDELAGLDGDDPRRTEQRVRVLVPWKGMILASVILTVVLNILLRIA